MTSMTGIQHPGDPHQTRGRVWPRDTDRDHRHDDTRVAPRRRASGGDGPLAAAETAFVTRAAGLCLDGRVLGHGLPARTVRLDELRQILTTPPPDRPRAETCWRHLAGQARAGGQDWMVGALGVALPALRAAAARLAGRGARDEDLQACLRTGFLEALLTVTLDEGRVWPRLYWSAVHAGDAWRDRQAAAAGVPLPEEGPAAPPPVSGHPDLVLARAVAAGVIERDEADLIGCTRLELVPLWQVAAELGVSRRALGVRRAAAEERLAAAISDGRLDRLAAPRRPSRPRLPDELWVRIATVLIGRHHQPDTTLRAAVEGIWWHERHGGPWAQLPARYGRPASVYHRYWRWRADGTWAKVAALLPAAPASEAAGDRAA